MSGRCWTFAIAPLPGARCATVRSVHIVLDHFVGDEWAGQELPSEPLTQWSEYRSLAFGDDHPDHPIDEDDHTIEWLSRKARPAVIKCWVNNLGYWPSELGEHWRSLILADRAAVERLLAKLGYRRVVDPDADPFPHPGAELYRTLPPAPGARPRPLFYEHDGEYLIARDGTLERYADANGNLVTGTPRLPRSVRAAIQREIAADRCGCTGCKQIAFDFPGARDVRLAKRWRARAIDEWTYGAHYVPVGRGTYLAVQNANDSCMLFRSRNHGRDWERVLAPALATKTVGAICARGSTLHAVVIQGETQRWMTSKDLGARWAPHASPAGGPHRSIRLFPSPYRDRELVVSTIDRKGRCRLHYTADGRRWRSSAPLDAAEVDHVAFSPDAAGTAGAVLVIEDLENIATVTTDGRTWHRLPVAADIDVRAVLFGRGDRRAVIGQRDRENLALRSDDAGRTWTTVETRAGREPTGVWVSRHGWWFWSTGDQKLLCSEDEGATWRSIAGARGMELHGASAIVDDPDVERAVLVHLDHVIFRLELLDQVR